MFKVNMNECLPFYKKKFQLLHRTHKYETRNFNNFNLPLCRLALSQRHIFFKGPMLWNLLPDDLRFSKSTNIFKKKLKRHLVEKY